MRGRAASGNIRKKALKRGETSGRGVGAERIPGGSSQSEILRGCEKQRGRGGVERQKLVDWGEP